MRAEDILRALLQFLAKSELKKP